MKNLRFVPLVACLAMLLAACSSAVGNADAGPNPGGGFYDGPNANVGHVNPWPGSYVDRAYRAYTGAYTSVGQAHP